MTSAISRSHWSAGARHLETDFTVYEQMVA
jgi:hypothetical protein